MIRARIAILHLQEKPVRDPRNGLSERQSTLKSPAEMPPCQWPIPFADQIYRAQRGHPGACVDPFGLASRRDGRLCWDPRPVTRPTSFPVNCWPTSGALNVTEFEAQ